MLSKQLLLREQFTQSKFAGKSGVSYNRFLDNYECRKIDEHYVEGQEPGILIPPLACSFSKVNPELLATVDEDGGLIIFNTNKPGALAIAQDWLAHRNAVFDVEWMPGENKLLTASGDQTIALWDVTTEQMVSVFRGHSSSVKTVRFLSTHNSLFASGSRDGHVMVWDRRVQQKEGCYQPVNVIRNAHSCPMTAPHGRGNCASSSKKKLQTYNNNSQDRQQSVTAVVFQDENTLISAGSVDGSVKVWDLRKNYTLMKAESAHKHLFPYAGKSIRAHGFSSLVLDSSRTRMFASCMDNFIYQFDCSAFTTVPVAKFHGHTNATFYVKTSLSFDDRYLLGGSSDYTAYIWQVDQNVDNARGSCAPILALEGHSNEVTGVAWSISDMCRLVTLSDDNTVWIWRLNQCKNDDLGTNNELGDIVGKTRRLCLVDKGISNCQPMNYLSHSGGLRSAPRTPRKVGLLHSPGKLSPAVLQSLKTLPSSSTLRSPGVPVMSASKMSCSLSQWLGKPSPRKLVVTPKKSVESSSTSCKEDKLKTIRPGVKRKLCAGDDCTDVSDVLDAAFVSHSSKTLKLGTENDPSLSPITARLEAGSPAGRILSAVQINFDQRLCDSLNKIDDSTKLTTENGKDIPTLSVFRSPTVDLPNFVLDPQPRTPIGRWTSPHKNRTPDWLTQFRMNKQLATSPNLPNGSPSNRSCVKSPAGRPNASPSSRSHGNASPVVENRKLAMHEKVSIRKFLNPSKSDKK